MDFNLGVLTTSFKPNSNCFSYVSGLIHTETLTDGGTTSTIEHKYHTLGLNNTSLCYPPYYHVGSGNYYSPAMCPSGWYAACGMFGAGDLPETRATCCPIGYKCNTKATETWSTLSCESSAESIIFVTVPDDSYQVWSRIVQLKPVINAAAVNVRWQSTDFVTTTPPPTSAPSPGSSIPPASPSSTSTSAPDSSSPTTALSTTASSSTKPAEASDVPPPPEQVMPTGTKIGIGVGVGGGLLAGLAVSSIYFMFARRKKRRKFVAKPDDVSESNGGKDSDLTKSEIPAELCVLHQTELQTVDNTHEMGTVSNIHEMNTSTPAVYPAHNSPWRSAQISRGWVAHELPVS